MVLLAARLIFIQGKPLPLSEIGGTEILKKMHASVRSASPVEGLLESTGPSGRKATMDFKAMYPKLFSGTMKMLGLESQLTWNAEGFHLYTPANKDYQKVKRESGDMGLVGIESLFGDEEYFREVGTPSKVKFEGKDALAVPATRTSGKRSRKVIVFVDTATFLPLGYDEEDPGAGGISHSVYKKLSHVELSKQDFIWKKPNS